MKGRYCLSIDTAGAYLGLAIQSFDKTGDIRDAVHHESKQPGRQSDTLLPTLTTMMKKRRIGREDLGLIAVNAGPGSFTGVRVGVAVARGLAQALEIPCIGLCGLEAMARQVSVARKLANTVLMPVVPALSGEVYVAAYRFSVVGGKSDLKILKRPVWTELRELETMKKKIKDVTVIRDEVVHAQTLGRMAIQRYVKTPRRRFDFRDVVPLYLQPSWAEREKLKRAA